LYALPPPPSLPPSLVSPSPHKTMAGTRLWTQLWFIAGVVLLAPFAFWAAWWPVGFERATLPPFPLSLQKPHAAFFLTLHVLLLSDDHHQLADTEEEIEGIHVVWSPISASTERVDESPLAQTRRLVKQHAPTDDDERLLQYWLVLHPTPPSSSSSSPSKITWRLQERFGYTHNSPNIITQACHDLAQAHTQVIFHPPPSRLLPLQRHLQVTLLSQDASHCFCKWDASRLLDHYLNPLLHQLAPLTSLPPSLQLLPFGTLLPPSTTQRYGHLIPSSALIGMERYWDEKLLPPSLASGGEGMGEPVPPLRVIFFCPATEEEQGLVFIDDDTNKSDAAVSSPSVGVELEGWGGVMVLPPHNLSSPSSSSSSSSSYLSDSHYKSMTTFLKPLLRAWLGFPPSLPLSLPPRQRTQVLHPLELDTLAIHTLEERRRDTLHRLSLLRDLLSTHPGMPCPARIADSVEGALAGLIRGEESSSSSSNNSSTTSSSNNNSSTSSRSHSRRRDYSSSSSTYFPSFLSRSNSAWASAQQAQQDEALLPPPHYPFEHYAAIFLPLLLPVLLPLLLGLQSEWTRYQEKIMKKKKKKTI